MNLCQSNLAGLGSIWRNDGSSSFFGEEFLNTFYSKRIYSAQLLPPT